MGKKPTPETEGYQVWLKGDDKGAGCDELLAVYEEKGEAYSFAAGFMSQGSDVYVKLHVDSWFMTEARQAIARERTGGPKPGAVYWSKEFHEKLVHLEEKAGVYIHEEMGDDTGRMPAKTTFSMPMEDVPLDLRRPLVPQMVKALKAKVAAIEKRCAKLLDLTGNFPAPAHDFAKELAATSTEEAA